MDYIRSFSRLWAAVFAVPIEEAAFSSASIESILATATVPTFQFKQKVQAAEIWTAFVGPYRPSHQVVVTDESVAPEAAKQQERQSTLHEAELLTPFLSQVQVGLSNISDTRRFVILACSSFK
jgi:hypothetical protein